MTDQTSSGEGATLQPDQQQTTKGATPITTTVSSVGGATPKPTESELLARIADLEHQHKNATEERDRHRKKLSSYEQKELEAQQAALSEVEKAKAQATAAEQQIQAYKKQLVSATVKLAAQAEGIIDPELAALAVQDKLEFGEDGMPTNVEKALKDLVKSKPFLKAVVVSTENATQSTQQQVANLPAMNPGRSAIPSPGTLGSTKKPIPSWDEVYPKT